MAATIADMDERDRDPEPAFSAHVQATHGVPDDARLLGLDRNTVEGSLVAMAGSLDGAKLKHKIVAWVLLVAFVGPTVLGLLADAF